MDSVIPGIDHEGLEFSGAVFVDDEHAGTSEPVFLLPVQAIGPEARVGGISETDPEVISHIVVHMIMAHEDALYISPVQHGGEEAAVERTG